MYELCVQSVISAINGQVGKKKQAGLPLQVLVSFVITAATIRAAEKYPHCPKQKTDRSKPHEGRLTVRAAAYMYLPNVGGTIHSPKCGFVYAVLALHDSSRPMAAVRSSTDVSARITPRTHHNRNVNLLGGTSALIITRGATNTGPG